MSHKLFFKSSICDLKIKHPAKDWNLKPTAIGRAAKFVNHPDNLPDIDFEPDQENNTVQLSQNKYNLRQSINPPTELDL